MSHSNAAGAAAFIDNVEPLDTAASMHSINIRFHRSAAADTPYTAAARPTSLRPPGLPLPRLSIDGGMTGSSSASQSPAAFQPSPLHTSSSFPISLSHALSTASPSTSPQPSSAVLSSVSRPSSLPAPSSASRVRPRPRNSSRPYQSLLKSASAEEASTSDDESRWKQRLITHTSQPDIPPYSLMHGSTYVHGAYGAQPHQPQQSHPSLPNGSSSTANSPVLPASTQQPLLPHIPQPSPAPFVSSIERPSYPQSRSRSNSLTSSSTAASSVQPSNASMPSPNHTAHMYNSARGVAYPPAEQSTVGALLLSARSLIGSLGMSRSPSNSPSATYLPSATYSYQPAVSAVGRPPSNVSPSASPLTLSHFSSAYPPPPLPAGTHSLLPPIHDDDDTVDSDDDGVEGELRVLTGEESDWSSDEEEDDSPTAARHDKYGRQRARNVRVIRLQCPSIRSLTQLIPSLWSSNLVQRCRTWCSDACCIAVSPDLWISSILSVSWIKNAMNRYKELPWGTREKLMFMLSSTLGTILFLFLFESFMIVNTYDLEDGTHGAFTLSYLLAYVISIAWQHALHRLLVFQSQSYCLSLLHTYLSYSFSLALMALLGSLLISQLHISARLVACVTLPLSAVANYYLLRSCITVTERWQQAQVAAAQPSPITRPFFSPVSQPPYAYLSQQQHQQQYDASEYITPPALYPSAISTAPSDDLSAIMINADGLSPPSISPAESVYLPYRSSFSSQSQSGPAATVLAYHSRAG